MTYISPSMRATIIERASNCCEYCLLNQTDRAFAFHIEHIISEKHNGKTTLPNLCLSCPNCNAFKGSDIGSLDPQTDILTPLFNPRTQKWFDHFRLDEAVIEPITPDGRVTVFLLRLSALERIAERTIFLVLGSYPCQISAE